MLSWQKRARIGVAVFGLVFAGIVYAAIRERQPARPPAPVNRVDPQAVVEMQTGVRQQISGAEEDYQIRFSSIQSYADGSARLFDVEIEIPNRHGRDFSIRAREAFAGTNQIDLRLTGNVKLSASDGFELTTAEATFDRDTLIARADGEVSFSKGRMRGSGVGMAYDEMNDVLRFTSTANVVTTDETGSVTLDFAAGASTLDRRHDVLSLDTGVRVLRGEQVLESDRAVGRLSPANDEIVTYIELRGNARVTGGSSSIDSMSATDIDLDYTDDGQTLERVLLNGSGAIGMPTTGESGRQLLGDHLDLRLAPDGSLLRAIGAANVRLDLPSAEASPARSIDAAHLDATGESGKGLTAATFWNDACAPRPNRDSCVVYREKNPSDADAARVARATRLVATLADDALTAATFTGTVTFEEDGLAASGAEARYAPSKGTLHLTGSDAGGGPRVMDAQITIDADDVDVTLNDRHMTASGNVRTTLAPRPADTSRSGPEGRPSKLPTLLESSETVTINADRLEYDGGGKAVYTGRAALLQGTTTIRGRALTLDQERGDLVAEGTATEPASSRIRLATDDSIGFAPLIRYDDGRRTITYSAPPPGPTNGRVLAPSVPAVGKPNAGPVLARLNGPDGDVTARAIDVVLAAGERRVERLEARDDVTIRMGTRTVTGAQLVFHAAEERYVMTAGRGVPVRLIDRVRAGECNETVGQSLIFFRGTDRMIVDSTEVGRTQTKGAGPCGSAPASR